MNNDFIEIVRAAQLGDNRAFEALYNMTKDSSYFIALSITKNEQDALDIMQDSYIKAFGYISTLNAPELFDNWLGRIVANTSKNYISKKKPILFADVALNTDIEWNDEEFNKDYLPHESVDTKETSRLLMEIINGLSEDKRLCILMYYYQDMSVKEIAETLELPVTTVKYKLLSARAEIKKGVEDLEKRGTKLYGVFPFALFTSQFKNIETEFLTSNTPPAFSSMSLLAQAVQMPAVASQVTASVAQKGFFSTIAGKIIAVAIGAVIVGGGITAAVVGIKNANKPDDLDSTNDISSESVTETEVESVPVERENTINMEDVELFDLSFELDGVVYTLPCDFSEFEENGWEIVRTGTTHWTEEFEIRNDNYSEDSYNSVKLSFLNTTSSDEEIEECQVVGFSVFVDVSTEGLRNSPVVKFPGGLSIDRELKSEDVIAKHGEPDEYYNRGYEKIEYYKQEGDYKKGFVAGFYSNMSTSSHDLKNKFSLRCEYSPETALENSTESEESTETVQHNQ